MSKQPKRRAVRPKRFIIKKYVMARSAQEALRKEKRVKPDDVWVDEDWKKENPNALESCIGFNVPTRYDEYDE
jgi:hypothetical protein